MDEILTVETREQPLAEDRQRLTRWAEEGVQVLRAFPELLAENDRLTMRAEAAERECERLRQEVGEVAESLRRLVHENLLPLNDRLQGLRGPKSAATAGR